MAAPRARPISKSVSVFTTVRARGVACAELRFDASFRQAAARFIAHAASEPESGKTSVDGAESDL